MLVNSQPRGPWDLQAIYNERSITYSGPIRIMQELLDVREGLLPDDMLEYFHEDMHIHVVNSIRLAHDDLTAMAAKVFPVYISPDNNSDKAKTRAEKLEKVCYGYNEAGRRRGGLGMKGLMGMYAWWLVLCANAVGIVYPDFGRKTPYFSWRDPRHHLPPVGWTPYSEAPLDDTMFAYETTVKELKMRFPESSGELSRRFNRTHHKMTTGWKSYGQSASPHSGDEDSKVVMVAEWYSSDAWYFATIEDKPVVLLASEQGDRDHPDICPVVPFSLYSPDTPIGRSFLADQVTIQAAMSRMFSQKLDFFDRTLWPPIITTPLDDVHLKYGPGNHNTYKTDPSAPNPRADILAPSQQVDADTMMGMAMGFLRLLNRNPESMQGAGQANSAKALNELKEGISSFVQDTLWRPFLDGIPRLYSHAMKMDLKLWPNEKKEVRGKAPSGKERRVRVAYTPSADLKGYEEDVEVEPGIGLAGYAGRLEIMQLVGAELLSEDTAFEQLDFVREPVEEKRRIQQQRLERLMMADLEAKAQQGILQPGAFWEIRKQVADGDTDIFEAISKLETAGRLYIEPPSPEEALAPGPPGGGDLAALLGGGLEAGAIPGGEALPTLEGLRS